MAGDDASGLRRYLPQGGMAGLPRAAGDAVAVAGLWLLLAGSVQAQELGAAALVGVAAGWLGLLVRAEVDHRHAGLRRHAPAVAKMYLGAVRDSWTLTRALLTPPVGRAPKGRVRRVPFEYGSDDDRASVGRRVVTTLGTSLQPNTYVLGFDRERGVVLLHELVPDEDEPVEPSLRNAPGGGP